MRFFNFLGRNLNVQTLDDWYRIFKGNLKDHGAASILRRYYGGKLSNALKELYPEHNWEDSKFAQARLLEPPRTVAQQRGVWLRLEEQLAIKKKEDWYFVTKKALWDSQDARYIMKLHNDSLRISLAAAFPEHHWRPWLFADDARGYWQDISNQREFLDCVGKEEFSVSRLEEWYSVSLKEKMIPAGVRSMLTLYYGNSLPLALVSVYPEHKWEPWRFKVLPRWFWRDQGLPFQKLYMKYLEAALGISALDSWYRISRDDLRSIKAKEFPARVGLRGILQRIYPDHVWERKLFSLSSKKSSQRRLRVVLATLFPGKRILEEFRLRGELLELDYYMPEISLAFEFQGRQHYKDVHAVEQADQRLRTDLNKLEACKAAGITFIEIPYWQELSSTSVSGIIQRARPDLLAIPVACGKEE